MCASIRVTLGFEIKDEVLKIAHFGVCSGICLTPKALDADVLDDVGPVEKQLGCILPVLDLGPAWLQEVKDLLNRQIPTAGVLRVPSLMIGTANQRARQPIIDLVRRVCDGDGRIVDFEFVGLTHPLAGTRVIKGATGMALQVLADSNQ